MKRLILLLLLLLGCGDNKDAEAERFWRTYAYLDIEIIELKQKELYREAYSANLVLVVLVSNADPEYWDDEYKSQYDKWYKQELKNRGK